MSNVRFIADLHFGHTSMAIKRGFTTVEEHDEHIIKQWNSVVHKRDTTYILGDITMETSKPYPLLARLNGVKHVVLGNHDMPKDVAELSKYVVKISGMIKYKGMFLTHCPIHPMELDHKVNKNIHGHIHENIVKIDISDNRVGLCEIKDDRYIGVSCEQIDYTPKTLKELEIQK
jgi:calcineurin-like phosphoesterase family protein